MATTTYTPSMLKGAGTRGVPEVPAGYENTYSMEFDGADESIATGFSYDSAVDANFSVSFWFKQTSTAGFSFPVSMPANTGGAQNSSYSIVMMHANRLLIKDRTGWNYGTDTSLDDGDWHHIIVTAAYSGNTTAGTLVNAYIDGNLTPDLTSTTMGWAHEGPRLKGDFYIGAFYNSFTTTVSNFYTGQVDEVAVWKSILSSADITAIYNSGVPDDLSSLSPVGWWRMGEKATWDGSNWALTDQGSGGNDGTSDNMEEADRKEEVPS